MTTAENQRGYLYDDPLYADEMERYWPQDLIATAYVPHNKAKHDGMPLSEVIGDGYTAEPTLDPVKELIHLEATDRAHILALGVDQGWLHDTSFGADQYGHQNNLPSSDGGTYRDQTYLGDFAAGTWWFPTLAPYRNVYPFGTRSSSPGPFWRD